MIIGICDYDIMYISEINKLISLYAFKCNVDITIKNYTSLYELSVDAYSLNIIFLDIRFNHETLGVDWAKEFRKKGNANIIVFCSSLKDMAFQGYEAEAFRFLLKPVSDKDLYKVLDACFSKLKTSTNILSVTSSFGKALISIPTILYIQSKQRRYNIYLKDLTVVITYENLKTIYERINLPNQFKYTHKSYIVNLAEIKHLDAYKLYMSNGFQIPVSRSIAAQLKKDLIAFIGGCC